MNFSTMSALLDAFSNQLIIAHRKGHINNNDFLELLNQCYNLNDKLFSVKEEYESNLDDIMSDFVNYTINSNKQEDKK